MTRVRSLAIAVTVIAAPALADSVTIRDGVYTEAQARRGEAIYPAPCGKCHGLKLDGAPDDPDMESTPPVAGRKFLRDWNDRSLAALYQYTRTTMPENNPGFLSDQEFADIIAYMLQVSGAPSGNRELRGDMESLGNILIAAEELSEE